MIKPEVGKQFQISPGTPYRMGIEDGEYAHPPKDYTSNEYRQFNIDEVGKGNKTVYSYEDDKTYEFKWSDVMENNGWVVGEDAN